MANQRGFYFMGGGNLFKVSQKEAKRLLGGLITRDRGDEWPKDEDEVAPVFDLDKMKVEEAKDLYIKINLGGGKE